MMTEDQIVEAVARVIDARAWAARDQAYREPWGEAERVMADQNVAPSMAKARAAMTAHEAALREAVLFAVVRDGADVSVNWSAKMLTLLKAMDDQGEYADRLIDIAEELLEAADTHALAAAPNQR